MSSAFETREVKSERSGVTSNSVSGTVNQYENKSDRTEVNNPFEKKKSKKLSTLTIPGTNSHGRLTKKSTVTPAEFSDVELMKQNLATGKSLDYSLGSVDLRSLSIGASTNYSEDLNLDFHRAAEDPRFKVKNMCLLLTLLVVPIIALLILTAVGLNEAVATKSDVAKSQSNLQAALVMEELVQHLQLERTMSSLYMQPEANQPQRALQVIIDNKQNVDPQLIKLTALEENFVFEFLYNGTTLTSKNVERFVHELRNHVYNLTASQEIVFTLYLNITNALIRSMSKNIFLSGGDIFCKTYSSLVATTAASDHLSIRKSIGTNYWFTCSLTEEQRIGISLQEGYTFAYLQFGQAFDVVNVIDGDRIFEGNRLEMIEEDIDGMLDGSTDAYCAGLSFNDKLNESFVFHDLVTSQIFDMHDYTQTQINYILDLSQNQKQDSDRDLTAYSALAALICITSFILGFFYWRSIDDLLSRVVAFSKAIRENVRMIKREKRHTERILYQMLPKSIAVSLQKKMPVPPQAYKSVTVMYADVDGFALITSTCSPVQVVDLLNYLYDTIDTGMKEFDVVKMEAVGDSFMLASGVPEPNGDFHAKYILETAIKLMTTLCNAVIPQAPNVELFMKIGVNTGPCAAGVVGITTPRYSLFGTTISVAQKLKTQGEALKIHISDSTHKLITSQGGFKVKKRGVIQIKGTGPMTTYWVLGKLDKDGYAPDVEQWIPDKNHRRGSEFSPVILGST